MMTTWPRRSSPAQHHQLNRLTVQLGLATIAARNAYIGKEIGREVRYLVDLAWMEAQAVIEVAKVELREREGDATGVKI